MERGEPQLGLNEAEVESKARKDLVEGIFKKTEAILDWSGAHSSDFFKTEDPDREGVTLQVQAYSVDTSPFLTVRVFERIESDEAGGWLSKSYAIPRQNHEGDIFQMITMLPDNESEEKNLDGTGAAEVDESAEGLQDPSLDEVSWLNRVMAKISLPTEAG